MVLSETLKQLVDHKKAIFKKGTGFGLLDIQGNTILDFKYQLLTDYHDGKIFARLSEFINGSTQHTYGIVDEEGQLLLESA